MRFILSSDGSEWFLADGAYIVEMDLPPDVYNGMRDVKEDEQQVAAMLWAQVEAGNCTQMRDD